MLLVQNDCADPAREQEYNRWYDEVQVPDMLQVPGVVNVTRYVNLAPEANQRPKYVILYEIETEDIANFENIFHKTVLKAQNAGRMIDFLAPERHYPFQPPYYQQITQQKAVE